MQEEDRHTKSMNRNEQCRRETEESGEMKVNGDADVKEKRPVMSCTSTMGRGEHERLAGIQPTAADIASRTTGESTRTWRKHISPRRSGYIQAPFVSIVVPSHFCHQLPLVAVDKRMITATAALLRVEEILVMRPRRAESALTRYPATMFCHFAPNQKKHAEEKAVVELSGMVRRLRDLEVTSNQNKCLFKDLKIVKLAPAR